MLNSSGETSSDILPNVFKGYAAASDQVFREYVRRKKDEWEEGSSHLMVYKFVHLVNEKLKATKTREVWYAPSEDQTEMMALSSKSNKLTKKLSKSAKAKAKKVGGKTTKESPKNGKPSWMSRPTNSNQMKNPRYGLANHGIGAAQKPEACVKVCDVCIQQIPARERYSRGTMMRQKQQLQRS
jgi:hypothetical protein